jgi:tRNA-binding EMAP/Myf-like protein
MNITLHELQDERQRLTKDFDELKNKIQKVEVDLGAMKGNLNAINGAVQFATNLINMATNKEVVLKKVKKKTNEKI